MALGSNSVNSEPNNCVAPVGSAKIVFILIIVLLIFVYLVISSINLSVYVFLVARKTLSKLLAVSGFLEGSYATDFSAFSYAIFSLL